MPESELLDGSHLSHVAIHEAAHTALCLAAGYHVKAVRIDPHGGGVTSIKEDEHEMKDPAFLLAGYAAEMRWFGSTIIPPEGSPDYQAAERVGGPNFRDWLPTAEGLIEEHQGAILLIAGELKRQQQISGERARELYDQASQSGVISTPSKPPTRRRFRALPRKSRKSPKSKKLDILKGGTKERPVWTVKTPRNKPSFRVRKNDSGNRVMLRFRDDSGQWVESYCCYLSDEEWTSAQRKSLPNFIELIRQKLDERTATEGNDLDKINTLIIRVREITDPSITGSQPKGEAA